MSINLNEKIIKLLKGTNRKGIEELINYLQDNGFFESPCSTQFHLACEGGLAIHSLNVYEKMTELNELLNSEIDEESLIITGILHDVGKMGQFDKAFYKENYLKSGKQSDSKPYKTNSDLLSIPHEVRSIAIISEFIEIMEHEQFAILHHNGMYGDLKYQLNGKETPLQMITHFADMWASRVIEV